jgi:hypothetical protein
MLFTQTTEFQEGKSVIIFRQVDEATAGVIITSEGEAVNVRESVVLEIATPTKKSPLPPSIPIKIIGPGWGSMAYYPKEVLQRDGPGVFKAGTHMMWNHATGTEESERPEGNLNDLAAVLTEAAKWQDDGPKGPGLYSMAKVFSDFSTQVSEKGPHIGVSINAAIQAHEGTVEGKSGRIADKFVLAYSTDFVTKAGAGGAPIVPVVESQRGTAPANQEVIMTEQEAAALQTENAGLQARIKLLEAGQNHTLAIAAVGAVLTEAGIDFKPSLLARACKDPAVKEGAVDPEWVKAIVADFTAGEAAGKVTGMGGSSAAEVTDSTKSLRESLKALGVPEAGLDAAVEGRG